MLDAESWVLDLMQVTRTSGCLSSAYLIVRGSDLTARGTMQLRGPATSALLAVLQMQSSCTVRDMTASSRRTPREAPDSWRAAPKGAA